MGIYIDPGNLSFSNDSRAEIYVDKTNVLKILNKSIGSPQRYFAVSRPRRFGKSMAAGMIDAYYSIGCDSKELFAPFNIAKDPEFEKHLNKYHVLHFDVTEFISPLGESNTIVERLNDELLNDMRDSYPEHVDEYCTNAAKAIMQIYKGDGKQFVIIIDEWDCLIRDAGDDNQLINSYLKYLRLFFKTEASRRFLALGYITGILPIKKIEGESAMNNFIEYTMTSVDSLTPYYGFTQAEVDRLCAEKGGDREELRQWYDGYIMGCPDKDRNINYFHIYNPNSLVLYFWKGVADSYWKNTGAFRQLNDYIERNEEGLKDTIVQLLAGEKAKVSVDTFQNDLTSYRCRDDVLTALIHMGYLGYDSGAKEAFIPNEEVRAVFDSAIKVGDWTEIREALNNSEALLRSTWERDEEKVAEAIEKSHQDFSSIINYNNENALACAIMMSYYTAREHYVIVRELPSGKGFADIAFIPKRKSDKPAMIVELKWDKSADTAIKQIHDRRYQGQLKGFGGEILLVGISYDRTTKKYDCIIE